MAWDGQFLTLLTCKCASRHNGVYFQHLDFQKWSQNGVFWCIFVHFDFQMCFAPQRRAIFHLSSPQLAPHPPLLLFHGSWRFLVLSVVILIYLSGLKARNSNIMWTNLRPDFTFSAMEKSLHIILSCISATSIWEVEWFCWVLQTRFHSQNHFPLWSVLCSD